MSIAEIEKRALFTLHEVRRVYRIILWIILLFLTVLILSFPVQLTLDYHPVASTYVFQDPLFFGILFSLWMFIIVFLGSSIKTQKWEGLVLVCLFGLVFIGFWTIVTPLGRGDMETSLSHIKLLEVQGRILSLTHWNYTGFDFPGIYFAVLFLSKAIGLDILASTNLLLIFLDIVLSALLYCLFSAILKSTRLATFAGIIAIMGNQILVGMYSFQVTLALPLLAAILFLSIRNEQWAWNSREMLLTTIILTAITIIHFVTSLLLFFVLLGMYFVQRLGNKRLVNIRILMLSITLPLAYEILWAIRTMSLVTGMVPKIISDFTSGESLLALDMLSQSNIGGAVPLWANVTRIFWWVFLYGLGTALAVGWLAKRTKLDSINSKVVGGLVGVILLGATATIVSYQGHQFHRLILYGSIFTAPIILGFFLKIGKNWKKLFFVSLAVLCILLAFPSFIINNDNITVSAFYPHENSVGQFLAFSCGNGSGVLLFSPSVESGPKTAYYYVPEAVFANPPLFTAMKDENGLWQETNKNLVNFESAAQALSQGLVQRRAIYMDDLGMRVVYQHIFGTDPNAEGWRMQDETLRASQNKVYENGFDELYTR